MFLAFSRLTLQCWQDRETPHRPVSHVLLPYLTTAILLLIYKTKINKYATFAVWKICMEHMHSFAVRLSVTGNYLTDMVPTLSLMRKYSCGHFYKVYGVQKHEIQCLCGGMKSRLRRIYIKNCSSTDSIPILKTKNTFQNLVWK